MGINLKGAPTIGTDSSAQSIAVADLVPDGDFWSWAETIVAVLAAELRAGTAHPEAHISRWRECLHHRPGDEMVVRRGDGSTS